jgi:hypothetical protein
MGGAASVAPSVFFLSHPTQRDLSLDPDSFSSSISLSEKDLSAYRKNLTRKTPQKERCRRKRDIAERKTTQKERPFVKQTFPEPRKGTWISKKSPKFLDFFLSQQGDFEVLNFPSGLELVGLNCRFRTVHKVKASMESEGFLCRYTEVSSSPSSKLSAIR